MHFVVEFLSMSMYLGQSLHESHTETSLVIDVTVTNAIKNYVYLYVSLVEIIKIVFLTLTHS